MEYPPLIILFKTQSQACFLHKSVEQAQAGGKHEQNHAA